MNLVENTLFRELGQRKTMPFMIEVTGRSLTQADLPPGVFVAPPRPWR
ncbi:MAG: hypothetical protein IPK71_13765 [Myxococcales bacterium]|nr:hypothetical protein [Myxococcales bacterium]